MHSLLTRQIKKHLGTENVPEGTVDLFEAISATYQQNDDDRILSKRSKEQTSSELLNANKELKLALKNLEDTQAIVIHQEKMASLGELIASISHEINTPAGAIFSTILEIKHDYKSLLDKLTLIIKGLDDELLKTYSNLCEAISNNADHKNTNEIRKNAREMERFLSDAGIEEARTISNNLVTVGVDLNHIPDIIKILQTPLSSHIYNSLFQFGMSQIHVKDMEIAIGRITSLVKALKNYSRSDTSELTLTDIRKDIDNTLTILAHRLRNGVTVHKQYEAIPAIQCYASQLNQVWTNLINNAIEAMQGNGDIWITVKSEQDNIIIEIKDNGPGIPKEILDKIFDPYFTTKPIGEGTGLGLNITRKIINKHNGSISVSSQDGYTTFTITVRDNKDITGQSND